MITLVALALSASAALGLYANALSAAHPAFLAAAAALLVVAMIHEFSVGARDRRGR